MRAQDCACVRMQKAACEGNSCVCTTRASLALLFQKQIYSLIKSYSFHFNIFQVNLTSDWTLNQHWVLEFNIIREQGPES